MARVACQTIVACGTGPLTEHDCLEAVYPDIAASVEHLDIVDVLDGAMCRGQMTMAESEALLHEVMRFEYDYASPENCP